MLKKYIITFLTGLILIFGSIHAQAATSFYGAIALTGNTSGSLDSIDGNDLANGDVCQTITATTFYVHYLDASSGAGESSPDVVIPDDNAGSKRWILITQGDAEMAAMAQLTPTDGNYIVGDGSTWVAENGNTARTSLGLGTGDSPTFTNVTGSTSVIANTSVLPDASGDATWGSTSLEWGHGYIADDKKIYLGSDQDFSMEYDEDGNDNASFDGTDINYNGYYANQLQNIADGASSGPSYWFDGVNDTISCGNSADVNITTNDFSILFEATLLTDTSGGYYVGHKGSGSSGYSFYNNASGSVHCLIYDDAQLTFSNNFTPTVGVPFSFALTADRDGDAVSYGNGKITDIQDITGYQGSLTANQDLRLGSYSAPSDYINMRMGRCLQFNLVLTQAEIQALYSGADVLEKYRGASQTAIYESDFSAGEDGWAAGKGTAAGNIDGIGGQDNNLRFTCDTQSGAHYVYDDRGTNGKQHRITLDYYIPSGQSNIDGIQLYFGTGIVTSDIYDTLDAWTSITFEAFKDTVSIFIHGMDSGAIGFQDVGGDDIFYIRNISVTQIGYVLDLNSSGVGYNTWADTSINELHGVVEGPIPSGLPANHREKFIDLAVTGDTSFTLPKGYIINAIVLTSDGAIGGGIDIGTTDGGGEVVAAEGISGAVTVLCALVAGANYNLTGADDTIYITDADGTGWDAATVKVRVQMERIALD